MTTRVLAHERSCPRCEGVVLEAMPDPSGAWLAICPRCDGVFVEVAELERALGGPPPSPSLVELPNPFGDEPTALVCPVCARRSLAPVPVGSLDRGAYACDGCGARFFDARAWLVVRRGTREAVDAIGSTDALELDLGAMRPTLAREHARGPALPGHGSTTPDMAAIRNETRPVLANDSSDDGSLAASRFDHADPWSNVLSIPIAFAVASALVTTEFGYFLATPFRIQFHELGHAVAAWITGRFALPLPCGLTLWSNDASPLASALVVGIAALLVASGYRERRRFSIALGLVFGASPLLVRLVVRDDLAFVLLAGGAGEMLLPTVAIVSFYFRMPDRLRWDFFRFLVMPTGVFSYVAAMRLWRGVVAGSEAAPLGSLLGTAGDGTGDLERLVMEHGLPLATITRGYLGLGIALGVGIALVYGAFATIAIRRLRELR